ncbi:MAG: hypothetical protein U5L95_00435 [Candidatus Saccharibacteria bacterium]|nr:hypothetical protein [Candidatus Saccharibacteria bacterium]
MERLKYGIVGALMFGSTFYLGAHEFDEWLSDTAEEVNEDVEDCARALGEVPLSREVLPVACEQFDYAFDFVGREITERSDGTVSTSGTLYYETPSGEQFLADNRVDPEEYEQAQQAERQESSTYLAGFGAFLGFVFIAGGTTASSAKEQEYQS